MVLINQFPIFYLLAVQSVYILCSKLLMVLINQSSIFFYLLAALEYVSKCSHIVRLKLGKCKHISDNGLAHIARNCPKLTDLDLSGY